LGKLLQAASKSCEARVWGNCYKLQFRAAKREFGETATSCQLDLLKENLGKSRQAYKAAERARLHVKPNALFRICCIFFAFFMLFWHIVSLVFAYLPFLDLLFMPFCAYCAM
jgi:hypothetical protein